jgi:hypothetical protein
MTRITTNQAATARPQLITVANVPTTWTTVLEPHDYSVPDTTGTWPERDPADATRRIQPGQALIEAPLLFWNKSVDTAHVVEVRIVTEAGAIVQQVSVSIPPLETYSHPAPGQILTKRTIASSNGDRLQIKAAAANAIDFTSSASFGAAEQDLPA